MKKTPHPRVYFEIEESENDIREVARQIGRLVAGLWVGGWVGEKVDLWGRDRWGETFV